MGFPRSWLAALAVLCSTGRCGLVLGSRGGNRRPLWRRGAGARGGSILGIGRCAGDSLLGGRRCFKRKQKRIPPAPLFQRGEMQKQRVRARARARVRARARARARVRVRVRVRAGGRVRVRALALALALVLVLVLVLARRPCLPRHTWLRMNYVDDYFLPEAAAEIGAHFAKGGERPVWLDPGYWSVRGGFAFRRSALRSSKAKANPPCPPFARGGKAKAKGGRS